MEHNSNRRVDVFNSLYAGAVESCSMHILYCHNHGTVTFQLFYLSLSPITELKENICSHKLLHGTHENYFYKQLATI